jgi:DNA ligase-1
MTAKFRCKIFLTVVLLLSNLFPLGAKAAGRGIMLPKVYREGTNISGWLVSEKLDGVRGYWDGRRLISKHGRRFYPPAVFTRNWPDFALEGEIWGGRGTFEQTAGVVKRRKADPAWLKLKFAIFDVPEAAGGFRQRITKARQWFAGHPSPYAFVIPQRPVQDATELRLELVRIEKLGGEGLMVRRPEAQYVKGRSADILKVKSYRDMEAVVKAHIPGSGKNLGRLGSLLVELPNGKQLKIGTGFSAEERKNPPPIGTVISFKYYGFYQSGLPKFPSFLRVRADNGL